MKGLLDTHTFIWWVTDHSSLSPRVRRLLGDGTNEVYFSSASAWEIAIKAGLGRLQFADEPAKFIPEQLSVNAFRTLPIEISHALQVNALPHLHRDPFDRMLVAQAQIEGLSILSRDPEIARYDVKVIW